MAQRIYGANDIMAYMKVRQKFKALEESGHRALSICIAKTRYSFSMDPGLRGQPRNFEVPIREISVSAGAGFVVVLTSDIMTMPGLPKNPGARHGDHRHR